MRFSSIVMAVGLASSIAASPVALEKKQTSAADTVSSIINTLTTAATANLATINNLVAAVDQNTEASLAIAAAVTANIKEIQAAFQVATVNLLATTNGAVGGVAGLAQQFGLTQLNALLADIQKIQTLLAGISVTVGLAIDNLTPAVLDAIKAELAALQAVVNPFVKPLTDLVKAITAANASAFVQIFGLPIALNGIGNVIVGILQRLTGLTLILPI